MEKILVIDDEISILQLCKRVLNCNELKVFIASDERRALEILARETIDLVLTDLKLGDTDGIELLKKIKKAYPQTAVIIVTAHASIESAIEALKNGAYDYLLKPFNLDELSSQVQKCLEHTRLLRRENILTETVYLYRFAQEMEQTHSEMKLLEFVLERAGKILAADAGCIFMMSSANDELKQVASLQGEFCPGWDQRLCERIAMWVSQKNEPFMLPGGADTIKELQENISTEKSPFLVIVPITHQKNVLGVLCLARLPEKASYPFTVRDLESLQMFALHAGLVLASLRHQKAMEELDTLKSEFLSNVSHEVRTPLMAISGAIELLNSHFASRAPDEKVGMLLGLIGRNTERMRGLVSDLLDFSRLESGQLKVHPAVFDLKTLVQETLGDLHMKAQGKRIALRCELSDGMKEVLADRERIKQVLVNLIDNAVKYTPEGGWVNVGCRDEGDGKVRISVSDCGIGIPPELQGRIFDKFYQVDGSMTREKEGFGLGLAIVQTIVQKHGGEICVSSEPGKGATFEVVLPRRGIPAQTKEEE
ncbi:MAG: ATP-binding protein [Endomicrobiales bacterium]